MMNEKKDKSRRMTVVLPVELEEEIRQVSQQTGVTINFLKSLVINHMLANTGHVIDIYLQHVKTLAPKVGTDG
jgi:hypothetical protein